MSVVPPSIPENKIAPGPDYPLPMLTNSTSAASLRDHAYNRSRSGSSSSRLKLEKTSTGLQKHRARLGLTPEAPIAEEHDWADHSDNVWPKIRMVLKEPFAEFWGTFVLVLFGDAAIAQVLLNKGNTSAPGGNGFGDYQSINWGWGLGLMLGIYVAGDSGAYLNPAVTLTNCLLRKLPLRRLPMYILAQLLGGFCAAGVVYANYVGQINAYEGYGIRTVSPSPTATAGIFATYPASNIGKVSQFFSEFIASAILMFVIFALKDDTNKGQFSASGSWFPLGLFFLLFGIGCAFGAETGYAINLARDFGPRLMTYILGYGHEVWSAGNYYFWVPMVAPFFGTFFGGLLYDFFIYTGDSPVNESYFGISLLFKPKEVYEERIADQKEADMV